MRKFVMCDSNFEVSSKLWHVSRVRYSKTHLWCWLCLALLSLIINAVSENNRLHHCDDTISHKTIQEDCKTNQNSAESSQFCTYSSSDSHIGPTLAVQLGLMLAQSSHMVSNDRAYSWLGSSSNYPPEFPYYECPECSWWHKKGQLVPVDHGRYLSFHQILLPATSKCLSTPTSDPFPRQALDWSWIS